jgi:hypothetical protein
MPHFIVLGFAQLQQALLLISSFVFGMALKKSLIIAAQHVRPTFARTQAMSSGMRLIALQKQRLHSYATMP